METNPHACGVDNNASPPRSHRCTPSAWMTTAPASYTRSQFRSRGGSVQPNATGSFLPSAEARVQQVLRQTRERVLRGNTKADGKLLSIFETHTEVIRKGKAHKPNEFGKLVLIQEAENQIVTRYQVCEQRPADATLLERSLEEHVEQFGHAPERVAADPGFFSAANESKAEQMGVKRVAIPSHDTKSAARKQRQKQRWFKGLQKWRTGCEGRISVLKRRHGLRRSLYRRLAGIQRWVGLGVIADNMIHIGTYLAEQARPR